MATLDVTKGRSISRNPNRWIYIDADHEVTYSESLIVDGNNTTTITLPSVPVDGTWVEIMLVVGDDVNINGNGKNIASQYNPSGGGTYTLRDKKSLVTLVYDGTKWTLTSNLDSLEQQYRIQSTNFNAVSGRYYQVDTNSQAVTVTLPTNPEVPDIHFQHIGGDLNTNPITFTPSGSDTIAGQSEDVTWDYYSRGFVRLHWSGSTWEITVI